MRDGNEGEEKIEEKLTRRTATVAIIRTSFIAAGDASRVSARETLSVQCFEIVGQANSGHISLTKSQRSFRPNSVEFSIGARQQRPSRVKDSRHERIGKFKKNVGHALDFFTDMIMMNSISLSSTFLKRDSCQFLLTLPPTGGKALCQGA